VCILAGGLLVTACSNDDTADSSEPREAVQGEPSTTEPAPTVPDPALAGLEGLIATTDRAGLQLVDPTTGVIEAEFVEDGIVTQPTWSRDGSQLVAMAFEAATNERLLLVDAATGTSREAPAPRPYFFFSWSPDGSLIAALGPGSPSTTGPRMTALDILDSDGRLVSSGMLEGGSLYIAWEPGGDSILAHRDDTLLVLDDPTDLAAVREIGTFGVGFQAPAWIPGTRDALITSQRPTGSDLVRVNVDTDEQVDLGPASVFVLIAVAPDGLSAAVAHAPGSAGESASVVFETGESSQGGDLVPATGISAVVELVDLLTGERTPVSDVAAVWVEWNPAGDALVALQIDLKWSVWSDGELRVLTADGRPSNIFLSNYVVFSGQYIETPRLWSPGGAAITYSGPTEAGNRFYVLPVGGDDPMAVDLGSAHVAFWSPG
jgi:hypothetical protein